LKHCHDDKVAGHLGKDKTGIAAISTHLVNWSIIIRTQQFLSSFWLKGPNMSICNLSIGDPAW
jgi:hypothetical protein